MKDVKAPSNPRTRAQLMLRRATDWAAGAREGRAYDRRRAAAQGMSERLAEGADLARAAERLQASVRPRRST
jgi:hypothetical protein